MPRPTRTDFARTALTLAPVSVSPASLAGMPSLQILGGLAALDPGPPPAQATNAQLDTAITISDEVLNRYAYATFKSSDDPLILDKGWKALYEQATYAFVSSPTRLKKYACLYKPYSVVPCVRGETASVKKHGQGAYDTANRMADFCRYVVENIYDSETGERQALDDVLWQVADAWHLGYSCLEKEHRLFTGGPYKGLRGYARFIPRAPQNIRFRLDPYSLRVMDIVNFAYGQFQSFLPLEKFLLYTYQPFMGLPYGKGDGRVNHKHVWSIDQLMRQWGLALQKHGGGFLKVMDNGADGDHRQKVYESVQKQAATGLIVYPKGMEINELHLPANVLKPIEEAIEWHSSQIATNILGQKLTTMEGQGKGTFALANIHQDTQEFFFGYGRAGLETVLTQQCYKPLVQMNFGESFVEFAPRHSQGEWNHSETATIANYIKTLTDGGIVHPDEGWIEQRLGIPPRMVALPTIADPSTAVVTPAKGQLRDNIGDTGHN